MQEVQDKTYGMTVRHQLYASDEEERYFHLYYSDQKASAQREQVEAKIDRMANHLGKLKGKAVTIGEGYRQYFELFIHEEDGIFLFAKEKAEVIERERDLCGYFVIITSKRMSAKEALEFLHIINHGFCIIRIVFVYVTYVISEGTKIFITNIVVRVTEMFF